MIKKIIFIVSIIFISCQGKQEEKKNYAIVSGKINGTKEFDLKLKGYPMDQEIEISSSGIFKDTIQIESPEYFIYSLDHQEYELYLKPGDSIFIDFKELKNEILPNYRGDRAYENNFLLKKEQTRKLLIDSLGLKPTLSTKEIKQKCKILKQSTIDLIENYKVDMDSAFLQKEQTHNHINYLANLYKFTVYRVNDSTFTNDYSEGIQSLKLFDDLKYQSLIDYRLLMDSYVEKFRIKEFATVIDTKNIDEDYQMLETNLATAEKLPKGLIKDKFVNNRIFSSLGLLPEKKYLKRISSLLMESTNDLYKTHYQKRLSQLNKLEKGNRSPVFSDYKNYKGGTTSLEDFKGKYVYIDIWATWCVPCIKEIPSLKKIESKYHDKNIVFVSISVDEEKNLKKWKQMIEKKELTGVQLFAPKDFKSKFIEDYIANSIPRFILIDPEGNIITAKAPKPSDPKLIKIFNTFKI